MQTIVLKGPPQRMQLVGPHGGGVGALVSANAEPKVWRIPRNIPTPVPDHVLGVLEDGGFDFEVVEEKKGA
jgi:hypothetical protein